jgi:hypothetical protein
VLSSFYLIGVQKGSLALKAPVWLSRSLNMQIKHCLEASIVSVEGANGSFSSRRAMLNIHSMTDISEEYQLEFAWS